MARTIEQILYDCIMELSYVQSVENCSSGLCASSKGATLVDEGMAALGVKDLSAEKYQGAR